MSFLNPVNEPVLRFKSTDAGAPQIDYNARVAGDVKTVLKACLVTGYGAKASAGWTAANEVGHVVDFVSPSAAFSSYRLGIDDKTASSTTWYYKYQNIKSNPTYNTPTKTFDNIDKTHGSNGWQLLVTDRGIIFVELVQSSVVQKLSARLTYWGALKSGLPNANGKNICFFNIGQNATISPPSYFYSHNNYVHTNLEGYTEAFMSAATINAISNINGNYALGVSSIDLVSPIYLANSDKTMLIAALPPLLSKITNSGADLYGISETTVGDRRALSVCAGFGSDTVSNVSIYSRTFLIYLDYWEY